MASHPTETTFRSPIDEREHKQLRLSIEAHFAFRGLWELARGWGYISLAPGFLLWWLARGRTSPAWAFEAFLAWILAIMLAFSLELLTCFAVRRVRRLQPESAAPVSAPMRPVRWAETMLLNAAGLASSVLAGAALWAAQVPAELVTASVRLWACSAAGSLVCLLFDSADT